MINIIREKSFYKSLGKIAFPLALQNLISVGVAMTDTVMLGRLGETAISASALANQLFFILTFALFGLSGGSILGEGRYHDHQQSHGDYASLFHCHRYHFYFYWSRLSNTVYGVLHQGSRCDFGGCKLFALSCPVFSF